MEKEQRAALLSALRAGLSRVMVGKEEECELALTALIAGGHLLLEDVPGTGKTVLARTLAKLTGCSFARVQCTPDLLPSDVTGASLFDMKRSEFVLRKGPVFTQVLLADELNRATPRTQSALLECMEERQVTVDGETRTLERPFLVIATQNPIEIQGTFPLPEAQLDRFMLRIALGYPGHEESVRVLRRFAGENPLDTLEKAADAQAIIELQADAARIAVSNAVADYIALVGESTRMVPGVRLGASTRALLSLQRACQARALLAGRDFVTPDDVKALAVPALAHRLAVEGALGRARAQREAVEKALAQVAVPTEEA
ncbi:MAG: MoxR family ATPase [Eubacteriales bacterium]|nr:MoxR family ATPase [Eubacteriales bacterium]